MVLLKQNKVKFIIFKRTYSVDLFRRELTSVCSAFDLRLHLNFVTNAISIENVREKTIYASPRKGMLFVYSGNVQISN